MGVFDAVLERVRQGETTEADAERLKPLLDAALEAATAEWGDGSGWRAVARLRQAVAIWNHEVVSEDKGH